MIKQKLFNAGLAAVFSLSGLFVHPLGVPILFILLFLHYETQDRIAESKK